MPELAEVELLKRDLGLAYLGQTIIDGHSDSSPRFREGAAARGTVVAVERAAKLLSLGLTTGAGHSPDTWLCIHLGMTGRLYGAQMAEPAKWRVRWTFDETSLILGDVRGFGYARLLDERPSLSVPAPGDPGFDLHLRKRLARTGSPVFLRLLDQSIAPGVGSYLAQEALWDAGVSPLSRSLSTNRCNRLMASLLWTIDSAVKRGGLSMRDYRRLDGSKGMSLEQLSCYQRAGLPCLRCGKTMVRSVIGGRGVSHCSKCQR